MAKRSKKSDNGDIFPKWIKTLRDLCECYRRCWPDIRISVKPESVKHWQHGRRLSKWIGKGKAPPHPLYKGKESLYEWAECKAWFEKVMLPQYKRRMFHVEQPGAVNGEDDIESIKDLKEREAFEHQKWEHAKIRGEFVSKSLALATGIAAVKKLHMLVRSEDERQLPNQRRDKLAEILKAEGVKPELADKICAEMLAWDIELGKAVTDRRETAMEEASKLEIKSDTKI